MMVTAVAQPPHDRQDRVALGRVGIVQHLHGAFRFQLPQAALELLLLADIGVAQQRKVLRLEARDGREAKDALRR